jgi:multidrug efflux pump subunit AcrA (membrane-fusion protein)
MYASARIVEATAANAVLVPKDAIATKNGKRVVQKVDGSTVTVVEIVEGLSDGSRTQVVKGLTAGDTVFADARKQLAPGSRVRAIF